MATNCLSTKSGIIFHVGFLLCVFVISGCVSVGDHAKQIQAVQDGERLTVGSVQREVRIGMSGVDVLGVLGSPNIVSTDGERREVWVYDKIATEKVHSTNFGGVNALVLGGGYSSGARSTSQRTLTVIIKFDESKKVRDFAYHTSRF